MVGELDLEKGGFHVSYILDDFLEFLSADDRWHDLTEVAAVLGITDEKASMIARFFARYNFIRFDANGKGVKIDVRTRELFRTLERVPVVVARH